MGGVSGCFSDHPGVLNTDRDRCGVCLVRIGDDVMKNPTAQCIESLEWRRLAISRGCAGCSRRGARVQDNHSFWCRIGETPGDLGVCRRFEEDIEGELKR